MAGHSCSVVVYGAQWCPVTAPLTRAVTKALEGTAVKVDYVDCERDPTRADRAFVVSLPTVVVMAGKKELLRYAGVVNPRDVAEACKERVWRAPRER